jgi:hypothetical protein
MQLRNKVCEEDTSDQYLALGPFQPKIGNCKGGFQTSWYQRFPWVEYSLQDKSAFCFPCYIFSSKQQSGSRGVFVQSGFRNWKHAVESRKGLIKHDQSKDHMECLSKMELRRAKILPNMLSTLSTEQKSEQDAHLHAAAKVIMHLAVQGLAFRGHDETQ